MVDPRIVADAMYQGDEAVRALGIEIVEVTSGRAVVEMVVRPDMTNQHAVCHGGIIFTLADTAMAYASNGANDKAFASHASIDFVNAGRIGSTLTAIAEEQSLRGRAGIYDAEVTDGDGVIVAVFRGNTLRMGEPIVTESPEEA